LDEKRAYGLMDAMGHPLIAPAELDPPGVAHLTPTQRIALWADLMEVCEQFLLAGLRRKVGPDGDVAAAYREWHKAHMMEHDRAMQHMLEELERRSGRDAR